MAEILLVRSLQRKVTVITSVAIAAALLLGVHGAQIAERNEQHQHLDMHLAEVAQTVIEFCKDDVAAAADLPPGSPPRLYTPPNANLDLSFQVWRRDGSLLLETNMPPDAAPLMPLNQMGFANGEVEGKPGRMFALPAMDQSYIVQVAEQFEDHDNDAQTLLRYYFLPIALPLLFAMVATWALLRRSAYALDTLVRRLRQLDPKHPALLSIDRPTHEIKPVIAEFNTLIKRTSSALQSEQRFTSMAAHELRTPWAGIKAQAQMALRSTSAQEQRDALQAVIQGVNRASHVFDQLIDLTRLDSVDLTSGKHFQSVSMEDLYAQVMGDLTMQVQASQPQMRTLWHAPSLYGVEFALYLLLRNLVSNAILYGGPGAHIEVTTQTLDDGVELCVDDSGIGIAPEAREQAFERFNRLHQHGPDGVGLGLSIVQMVVTLHHASIHLEDSALGGLRARVVFPSAANSPAQAHDDTHPEKTP